MTQDFVLGQLRLAMVAMLAYAGGKGWLTPADSTLALALTTSLGPVLVPWIWSIVHNAGQKLVPQNSIAIAKTAVDTPDMIDAKKGDFITAQGAIKVVGALLIALALASAMPRGAYAQPLPQPRPATLAPAATKSFLDIIRQWVSADIEAAITLSTSIPELQDTTGAACWKTFRGIGDVITAHPLPITLKLASDIQAARLVSMSLKKVCVEPACAQVWLDMQNQVAALAPIGVPFTLNSICSKVL